MSASHVSLIERGGKLKKLLAVSTFALITSVALALPAKADLASMGNTDPSNNFPTYFQDTNGLRLDLCLDGPPDGPPVNCLASKIENVAPNDEAFWWAADASLPTSGGKDSQLVMAQEAAYFATDPLEGQEAAFQRVRVILQVDTPGTYTVTYPYGTKTYQVAQEDIGPGREVFDTLDKGCFPSPPEDTCYDGAGIEFSAALRGPIGPFLTWDTVGLPEAQGGPPAGFIGDAATEHKVVGSPIADAADPSGFQNYFKIEGPNVGGPGVNVVKTDLFAVQGRVHGVTAFASVKGGTFNADQSVSLTPSDPAAEIRYTTDPNLADADIATQGTVFDPTTPISIAASANSSVTTSLRFVAIDPATNEPSPVLKETYTVDKAAPVAPSVDLIAASDTGTSKTDNITNKTTPTFRGNAEAGSSVGLFDGTKKVGSTKANANGRYAITTSRLTNGVHPITAKATDTVGNVSAASEILNVTVDTVKPVIPTASLRPLPGSPTTDQTPALRAIVRDNQTDLAKANIRLSVDTVPNKFAYNRATNRLSATSRLLAFGRHNAQIVATDAAGNRLVKPWSFTVARR